MFKGKVVIITGSSAGIGVAIAKSFACQGAAGVVVHGRNEEALKKVKEQVEKAGQGQTKVHICVGDVTLDETRKKLIDETVKHFGHLDVLVNNAGLCPFSPIKEATPELFDKIFDVNLKSVIFLTQLALPHLVKTKGNIVNISTIGSLHAFHPFGFYCAAKVGLNHFTRCMAVEWGPQGVRVNCVLPGAIPDTELATRQGYGSADEVTEYMKKAAEAYPLKRPGTVDEIADAVVFLASDKAKFITGHMMPVDGGSTILR